MHRVGRRPGKQFVQSRRRPAIDELCEDVKVLSYVKSPPENGNTLWTLPPDWTAEFMERIMKTTSKTCVAAALAFAAAFSVSQLASAQQQAPDTQTQQSAPAQQGQGMGQPMHHDGMEHGGQMGQQGMKMMESEHGRMGQGMTKSDANTSANPPPPASK